MSYKKINKQPFPDFGIASCVLCREMFKFNRLNDHFREHFRPKCLQPKYGKKENMKELKVEYEQLALYVATKLGSQDVYAKRRIEKIYKEIIKRKTGSSFVKIVQGGKVSKR